ncbi:carboxyl transferase domain-containing protein [Nocardioides zeae]|uniref:Acyl-CoA carboxylase n=1 Tax=Nocardioides zeae TaxID=1457234 RepID=A0A6P0HG73_9ACTN|nr:acyl-CoA carboxylase [Nocardioides zeae]
MTAPAPRAAHELAAAAVADDARPEAVARQHARGKRTARERLDALVDQGSFREVGRLARPDPGRAGPPEIPGDGIVAGTATITGRPVVVLASDYTAAGGSNGLVGNEKQRRAWEIAAMRGIPVVMLLDGGGHRIQEGLDAATFAGGFDIQETQARLSGWVPMVAAILGPGYGQPTLAASLCDYVVAVRGIASIGMAPPALVRAATGEDVDDLGIDTPDAQASYGTIDLAVDDEDEAIDALRYYLDALPSNAEASLPVEPPRPPDPEAAHGLDAVVPADLRQSYDMWDVLLGIVDEGSEVELKSAFAPSMLTTLAKVGGRPVGFIANQPAVAAGALDADGAHKAAHLASLCDAFGIPVVVVIDLPGLAVGSAAERGGLARAAGRLVNQLGDLTVPTVTVVARKGYGGGYVVMSGGRTFHPDLVVAWPWAETAVMGVETAVEMVYRREVAASDDPAAARSRLVAELQDRLGAVRAGEGFGVDVVQWPSETRAWLVETLADLPRRRHLRTTTPRRHPVAPA